MPTFRLQFKRGSKQEWDEANPTLLDGEIGLERSDDKKILLFKVGDGTLGEDGQTVTGTQWASLPYASGPVGPCPEHEWNAQQVRFKNPDGTWGDYVDVRGPQGVKGDKGDPGDDARAVPATRTALGSVMVGDGIDVNAEGCISVDLDAFKGQPAPKLETARTITIAGQAKGSAKFDGSADITISVTLQTDADYVTTFLNALG